jgi:hypothetical protein
MTGRSTSRILESSSVLTVLTALALAPGCDPEDPRARNLDPCETPLQVLATTVLQRDQGKATEAIVPFEVAPEAIVSGAGGAPVCVVVTSLEEKPRVLASGRFTIDGTEVFGPSAFNQNTTMVTAVQELAPGPHELHARLTSAPGTSVRVHVLLGSAMPLPDDLVSGRAVVVPGEETVLSVAGATLTFPPGAVDAPVTVMAFEVSEPYGLGNRIELRPEGLQFNQPVHVDLPYDPLRLPPTVTEEDLLARGAIQVRHHGEWRPTIVDSANNIASATIEHFSHAQTDTWVPLDYSGAGASLWRIADYNVYVAEIPLGRRGYRVAIESTPAADASEPRRERREKTLRPVQAHLKNTAGDYLGVNLAQWDPRSSLAGIRDTCIPFFVDCGDPNEGEEGVGLLLESSFSSEDETIEYLDEKNNYFILISGTEDGGLYAEGFMHDELPDSREEVADFVKQKAMQEQEGGHAVPVGSRNSIRRSKLDDDACREPDPGERQTVLGIGEKCTGGEPCTRTLLLIATIGEEPSNGHICDVLDVFHATDAIQLDGGRSTGMVHNGALLNKITGWYAPARFVPNALAVSYHHGPSAPVIATDDWAGVNRPVEVHVTAGTASNGGSVKLHCGSAGSNYEVAFKSGWLSSGQSVDLEFIWGAWGKKTIYCTTFDEDGRPSPVVPKHVQVAQVDSITPTMATLGTATPFSMSGHNLPDTTVVWIPFCEGPTPGEDTLYTRGDSRRREFTCTPGGAPCAPGGPPCAQTTVVKHDREGHVLKDDIEVTFIP